MSEPGVYGDWICMSPDEQWRAYCDLEQRLAAAHELLREAICRPYSDPRDFDWMERAKKEVGDDEPLQ